jgi:hypothetical protein
VIVTSDTAAAADRVTIASTAKTVQSSGLRISTILQDDREGATATTAVRLNSYVNKAFNGAH